MAIANDSQQPTTVSKNFPVKPKLKPKPRNLSQTPESKYWSSFKPHQIPGLVSSINSIVFSPTTPHLFAATHSASLTLFSSQTLEKHSAISSFKDVVTCSSFRPDGSLLAASDRSNSSIVVLLSKFVDLSFLGLYSFSSLVCVSGNNSSRVGGTSRVSSMLSLFCVKA